MLCTALTLKGAPCKVPPLVGKTMCRWHSRDPEDVARMREEARRGGESKANARYATVAPLWDDPAVAALDLNSAAGVRNYLGATLRALAQIPFSIKTATAIGQIAGAQVRGIEAGELQERLAALEAGDHGLKLA